MAGPYYVDIGSPGAWNGRTGLDTSSNCWLGISGLQKAFDYVTAGNGPVYIKGTGDLSKFYSVGYDASSGTTMTDGEAVSWHDGAGVIHCGDTSGGSGTVEVEITSGNAPSDNDVITGTTSGQTITCTASIALSSVMINTNDGDYANGWIKFIGVNSSWVFDETRAIIDANNANVHAFNLSKTMTWFHNIEVKRTGTENGFHRDSGGSGIVFINCCANNCDYGWYLSAINTLFICCVGYANTIACYSSYNINRKFWCCFRDNTSVGANYTSKYIGCMAYDNGSRDFGSMTNCLMLNCVANGGDGDGMNIDTHTSNTNLPLLIGCRLTNHSQSGKSGIDGNSRPFVVGHSYFEDNDTNMRNDSLFNFIPDDSNATTNMEDQADTNEGYTDLTDGSENMNLNSDATMRRIAVSIPTS